MNKEFNVYKQRRNQIKEEVNSPITKKLKDITWEDVAGLNVPTADFISMKTIDNRDFFSDERVQKLSQKQLLMSALHQALVFAREM